MEYLGICPSPWKLDGTIKKRKVLGNIKQETAKIIKTSREFMPSNVESSIQGHDNSDIGCEGQAHGEILTIFIHPLSIGQLEKRFLPVDKLLKLLTTHNYSESLNSIPRGIKNNVYFVIKNEENDEKRLEGKQ